MFEEEDCRLCVCDLFLKMNKTRVFSTKVCVCVCACLQTESLHVYVYIIQTCEGEKDRQENGVCESIFRENAFAADFVCVCVCVCVCVFV